MQDFPAAEPRPKTTREAEQSEWHRQERHGVSSYLAPTGSFFLGVFLYHEPFTRGHLITFGLIWIALLIFTAEAVWRWHSARMQPVTVPISASPA